MRAGILAWLLSAGMFAPALAVDAQSAAPSAAADRCYGLLVFVAVYPAQGETASAAWVVGPFSNAECGARVRALAKAAPSPIKGGHLVTSLFGSANQLKVTLERVYQCVRDDSMKLSAGPDHIRGIYTCAPP